jgi:hypothetical protein
MKLNASHPDLVERKSRLRFLAAVIALGLLLAGQVGVVLWIALQAWLH